MMELQRAALVLLIVFRFNTITSKFGPSKAVDTTLILWPEGYEGERRLLLTWRSGDEQLNFLPCEPKHYFP